MATAYKFYRLLFLKNSVNDGRYYTINTLSLYEAPDGSGVDLALAGVATSNGNYNAQLPSYVNDGIANSYWESSNRVDAGSSAWLRIELAEPKVVRSFQILSTTYPNERPRQFKVQGSNDGTNFTDIIQFDEFMTTSSAATRLVNLWLRVSGNSKLEGGTPAPRVLIHDFSSGALLKVLTPDPSGNFLYVAETLATLLVTHLGPSGYKPTCDGPVVPGEV